MAHHALPDDQVWFFAYANFMTESVFRDVIGYPAPVEAAHVVTENAWLSFDYCGIPFVEPAFPSLIIQGFNDRLPGKVTPKKDDFAYLRYVHDRCFPGIPFTPPGELPPPAEGIAYRIRLEQVRELSDSSGFEIAQVRCRRANDEESDASKDADQTFMAFCLVAKEKYRSSRMMPTITSYASVYRGALTHGFSLRYMRHLSQLRPYNLAYANTRVHIAKRIFIGLILGPQFALFYLPIVTAQRLLGGGFSESLAHLKLLVSDFIRFNAIVAERYLFRPFIGRAGYVIDY